jgi:hypothetical protein
MAVGNEINFIWALLQLFGVLFVVRVSSGPQLNGYVRSAGNRFARDGKELGPQLGAKHLTGEQPREAAEMRNTSLCSFGIFGGKALPCLAVQKSRPHAPLARMHSAPAYFLCKCGP